MGVLDGKVAIVTGAGKGLGYYEAIALAKEGAAVTVVARTKEDVDRTAQNIEELGGRALSLSCDVSSPEDVNKAVSETVKKFGTVDILVNNAQIIPQSTPLQEWTEQMMRDCWESGYLGSWFFMLACFPYMKNRRGRIINTCSAAGHATLAGMAGYGAAKEAIRALTRSAAKEWGKYDILVNAISPAAITPGALECMDKETEEAILSMFVLDRWGDAEKDVGRTVVFLAGPDAGYLTGNTISVDGGAGMVV